MTTHPYGLSRGVHMATRSFHLSGLAFTALAGALTLSACGSSSNKATNNDAGTPAVVDAAIDVGTDAATTAGPVVPLGVDAMCPVVVKDSDCDKNQRPFVFVHGTYGSGANFGAVAMLLASNGFCPDRIVGVEYNSLGDAPGAICTGTNTPKNCGEIDGVINKVLADPKNVDAAG